MSTRTTSGSVHTYVDVPDFDKRGRDSVWRRAVRSRRADRDAAGGARGRARHAPRPRGATSPPPTRSRRWCASISGRGSKPAPINVFFHVFDKALQEVGATETLIEPAAVRRHRSRRRALPASSRHAAARRVRPADRDHRRRRRAPARRALHGEVTRATPAAAHRDAGGDRPAGRDRKGDLDGD